MRPRRLRPPDRHAVKTARVAPCATAQAQHNLIPNKDTMTSVWTPDKKYSDRERWICIYPAYINNKKTIAEGRRIPKDKCVENPTYTEIRDVLISAGLRIGDEQYKQYPREKSRELIHRGRIRIQLKNDDGQPLNPDFPTRESIMLHVCSMIPKLKSRAGKPGSGDQQQQAAGQSGGKKKGKGRR